MNKQRVSNLRSQINQAHASGNAALAAALQSKLHANFVADADRFMRSADGAKFAAYIAERP